MQLRAAMLRWNANETLRHARAAPRDPREIVEGYFVATLLLITITALTFAHRNR